MQEKILQIKDALQRSECVIIGGGAGLSSAAGFSYSGERFEKYFPDFIKKYGFSDMYTAGFYPFETLEEYWAYWSRYVYVNRYMEGAGTLYKKLFKMISHKDYFVITTNVDHQFQKAGFDKNRLFYVQGDYGLFQCEEPCCMETFYNKEVILQMVKRQKDMKIPTELIPKCPYCSRNLTMNLRCDDNFVEDEGWHYAQIRWENFLKKHQKDKILLLELGVGFNTPGIIKYPFWEIAANNCKAVYVCINKGESFCPEEISGRSVCINADICKIVEKISE